MLSLIMKIEFDSKLTYAFLVETSRRILSTPKVYKAFYKDDDFRDVNDLEIDVSYETIKNILINSLSNLIKRMGT